VEEMKVVDKLIHELDVPLLGIVSDDQHAIRLGVARVWPAVLHQLCHLHFLKAVQKPVGSLGFRRERPHMGVLQLGESAITLKVKVKALE
jgi:hypothetical protein